MINNLGDIDVESETQKAIKNLYPANRTVAIKIGRLYRNGKTRAYELTFTLNTKAIRKKIGKIHRKYKIDKNFVSKHKEKINIFKFPESSIFIDFNGKWKLGITKEDTYLYFEKDEDHAYYVMKYL